MSRLAMKFRRSDYPKQDPFVWSPGRAAAAQRRVNKELYKNALTPELAQFTSVEQRRQFIETHHDEGRWQHMRDHQAQSWRKGRRMLREASPELRDIVLRKWNDEKFPLNGASLCSVITMYARELAKQTPQP